MKHSGKTRRQFWLLAIILSLLAAIQVMASNRLIAFDNRLESTRAQILKFEQENGLLRQEIASASSLSSISQRADVLGLSKTPPFILMPGEYPVALK